MSLLNFAPICEAHKKAENTVPTSSVWTKTLKHAAFSAYTPTTAFFADFFIRFHRCQSFKTPDLRLLGLGKNQNRSS